MADDCELRRTTYESERHATRSVETALGDETRAHRTRELEDDVERDAAVRRCDSGRPSRVI